MSKTAAKPNDFIENVEFPTFDASKATDQFRAFAEKGVEQIEGSLLEAEDRRRNHPEGRRDDASRPPRLPAAICR